MKGLCAKGDEAPPREHLPPVFREAHQTHITVRGVLLLNSKDALGFKLGLVDLWGEEARRPGDREPDGNGHVFQKRNFELPEALKLGGSRSLDLDPQGMVSSH